MIYLRLLLSACVLTIFTGLAPKPKTFTIDTDASSATWHLTPDQHSGMVFISSGELLADNTTIKNGTVHVALNSLTVSSINDLKHNAELTARLKGKYFFDTYNHPVVVFKLTSVRQESGSNYILNGSLIIKGKSQPVRVPAIVNFTKKKINLTAQLIITQAKAGTSSSTDTTALKSTSNEFRLRLHLVAKR
jgi:polyisoprenoid-binding protein YceI